MMALPRFTKWAIVAFCILGSLLVALNYNEPRSLAVVDSRMMKSPELVRLWFFALDCDKPNLEFIAKEAVLSARHYTNLVPILMLHCKNAELEEWMTHHGVTIVDPGNSKLVKFLDENPDKLTNLGASTWYRIAIPTVIDELIEAKHEQITKLVAQNPALLEYALYTDADIVFVNNIAFQPSMLPRYFSLPVQGDAWCCSGNPYSGKVHTNAGVILMNVTSFREVEEEFTEYVLKHIVYNKVGDLSFNDQTAFHEFFPIRMTHVTWYQYFHMMVYYTKYFKLMYTKYYSDTLPKEYEWEPYLGVNPNAIIVHWHGPKVSMESCAQLHPHVHNAHSANTANATHTRHHESGNNTNKNTITVKSATTTTSTPSNAPSASTVVGPMVTTGPGRSLFADTKQSVLRQLLLHGRTAPYVLHPSGSGGSSAGGLGGSRYLQNTHNTHLRSADTTTTTNTITTSTSTSSAVSTVHTPTTSPTTSVYPPPYDWYTPMQLSPEDRAKVLKNGEKNFMALLTLTPESLEGYHYATSLYFAYMNVICSHHVVPQAQPHGMS